MIALDIGVVILAGGEATRLPGKLGLAVGEVPMIVRVYRNVSVGRPTFISSNRTFPPDIDCLLPAPRVADRWARRGPLAGMLSTMLEMSQDYVFAVAGDAPFVTSPFIDRLAARLEPGDEAVVPRHGDAIEPLAALYDRAAFVRAGMSVLESGRGSLRLVIAALAARFVAIDDADRLFTNVNTPADYAAVRDSS